MPIPLSELPQGPHLIAPYEPRKSGVDFLNLRQVNFNLMAECIPGTNNTTRFVRPYAVMCWIYWVYPRILKKSGVEEASSSELKAFREKVESLLLWGHMLNGVSGLAGTSSKMPKVVDGKVSLDFKSWGARNATNTSIQAAVQYGPSLLDLGGLGFLHKTDQYFYQVTEKGECLARALDEVLKQSNCYDLLRNLSINTASQEEAENLFQYWRVDETSPTEQQAFQPALYDEASIELTSILGRRSATIHLILSILTKSTSPQSEQNIRDAMAFPQLWEASDLAPGQQRQSSVWLLLQMRQLQRLALEALMGWVEGKIELRGTLPDEICDKALTLVSELLESSSTISVAEALTNTSESFSTIDEYLEARETNPEWVDTHLLCSYLENASKSQSDEACSAAIYSLLLLSNMKPFLELDPYIAKHLTDGESARVSMAYWFNIVEQLKGRPLKELIHHTIKNLIISQHFAVGTNRFDGESIRLRIILEENGLESLANGQWQPERTPDRLSKLLQLMVSTGMITKEDDHYLAR